MLVVVNLDSHAVRETTVHVDVSALGFEPGETFEVRDEITAVLAPLGLRLSQAKTRVVDMREGFDFLGFHIKWMRKRGTDKWFVYTFIADKPVREFKRKIRALTHRTSQTAFQDALTRINQIQRGWANYFKYAVAKWTFSKLDAFTWWRLAHLLRARHGWNRGQLRRHLRIVERHRPLALPDDLAEAIELARQQNRGDGSLVGADQSDKSLRALVRS